MTTLLLVLTLLLPVGGWAHTYLEGETQPSEGGGVDIYRHDYPTFRELEAQDRSTIYSLPDRVEAWREQLEDDHYNRDPEDDDE